MTILIPINQSASIANGHESPHSTELFDIPVTTLPETMRRVIAQGYDSKKHYVVIGGQRFDQARDLALVKPLRLQVVISVLTTFYRRQLGD